MKRILGYAFFFRNCLKTNFLTEFLGLKWKLSFPYCGKVAGHRCMRQVPLGM